MRGGEWFVGVVVAGRERLGFSLGGGHGRWWLRREGGGGDDGRSVWLELERWTWMGGVVDWRGTRLFGGRLGAVSVEVSTTVSVPAGMAKALIMVRGGVAALA